MLPPSPILGGGGQCWHSFLLIKEGKIFTHYCRKKRH